MKLSITRSNWLRGEGPISSFLLREEDSKMCCLGFLAKACGAQDGDIVNSKIPSYAKKVSWPKGIVTVTDSELGYSTDLTIELMEVNDLHNKNLSDSIRETKLKEMFASIGIEVEFVE